MLLTMKETIQTFLQTSVNWRGREEVAIFVIPVAVKGDIRTFPPLPKNDHFSLSFSKAT